VHHWRESVTREPARLGLAYRPAEAGSRLSGSESGAFEPDCRPIGRSTDISGEAVPMQKHVMLVYSDPTPGREDEYNAWYNDVHLKEVLATEGFVRAQRFKVSDIMPGVTDHKYVAIYEIEADDLEGAMAALKSGIPGMTMSDAFNMKTSRTVLASAVSDLVEG
jgi:hypothetical protein